MIDQTASTNADSRVSTLGKKVIRITSLLLVVEVTRVILPLLILSVVDNDFALTVVTNIYFPFIVNAIFACVMYAMNRRSPAAIPVSILAFVYPVYGGFMYILSTGLLQDNE
jgi:hypothetical protein